MFFRSEECNSKYGNASNRFKGIFGRAENKIVELSPLEKILKFKH